MIDTHVHFWHYEPVKDAWITDHMMAIKRDFTPVQLEVQLKANGVDGCVAVQADQSENETKFLLAYAEQFPFIKGVVGWVDLREQNLAERLAHFAVHHQLKGWRHIAQAEPDGFLASEDFLRGIAMLKQHAYTYDILIHKGQLKDAITLAEKFPDQKFILNHLAKPDIAAKKEDMEWYEGIKLLAQQKNVYCKVSGMVTEANWLHWKYNDMVFYLDAVFEHFGFDRVMFGSDWPVCTLAATYAEVKHILNQYTLGLEKEQQNKIFETNAIRCYNL